MMAEKIYRFLQFLKVIIAPSLLLTGYNTAKAVTIYHVVDRDYLIKCDDGSTFAFKGSTLGAVEVGQIICKELGSSFGSVNPTNPVEPVRIVEARNAMALVAMDRTGHYRLIKSASAVPATKPVER
jgi:hypothetical protein